MRRSSSRPSCRRRRSAASACKSADIVEVGKAWQKKKAEGGWACLTLAEGLWRPRRHADREGDLAAGGGRLRQADAAVPDRRGHVRPDRDGLWQRGRQAALSAEAGVGREHLVPAVFRTRRRLRRRRAAHPRREGRRRLDHQRPEDLDLRRALLRLRPADHPHRPERAQAQGPHHVLPRHEERGRRGEADQAGQRHAGIQRGVLHRRADSGQPAARRGRRRLERVADHADERADVDRRAARHRLSRTVRVLQQPDARGRPGDRRPRHPLEAGEMGGAGQRPEIHQLPGDVGAVEGRAAGAGEFDRQAGRRHHDAGHRQLTRWTWKAPPAC